MYLLRFLIPCLILLFSGCATPPLVKGRFFWPPPPNPPRIEIIKIYSNQYDFPPRFNWTEWLFGKGPAKSFKKPVGIASDGEGKVYIADPNQASVVIYDLKKYTIITLGEPGLFQTPIGICIDGQGRIYVTDTQKNKVFVFDKKGESLFKFGEDNVNWPAGIAVDNKREKIYVVNSHGHNVSVFNLKGESLFTFGERGLGNGKFNFPIGVTVNSRGEVLVVDSMNALIQIFDTDGNFLRQFGERGDQPMDFEIIKGVAVDKEDNIYVVDGKAGKLLIFSDKGEPLLNFNGHFFVPKGVEGPMHGGLMLPSGIGIDKNNTIFITDTWNKRFQVYQYMDEEYLKKNPVEPVK